VLGGVHFIEVHLQQKTVGGTEISVQSGGVHFIEVFTKGGFTVILWTVDSKHAALGILLDTI